MVVGAVLLVSLVVTAIVGPSVGITGWLLVGVLANLLGVTALETYREVARGLDRYVLVSTFYVVANLLQLLAIVVAAGLGSRSASLFVIIYGLSSVVTLIGITVVSPLRATFSLRSVHRDPMREVLRIAPPVLLQSVFYTIWFRADLVLLERLHSSLATGEYGAAKTLTNALMLAPTAISFVLLPRVPRLALQRLPRYLGQVLALLAVVTVPPIILLIFAAHTIIGLVFGGRYEAAASPLAILAVGMGLFGFCSVFGNLWLGLRKPMVDTVSTGVGMVGTVAAALVMIPHLGLIGAAFAFSLGAGLRLIAVAAFTLMHFRRVGG
jgi:O-antigen/teichoic acid export membrane protein